MRGFTLPSGKMDDRLVGAGHALLYFVLGSAAAGWVWQPERWNWRELVVGVCMAAVVAMSGWRRAST